MVYLSFKCRNFIIYFIFAFVKAFSAKFNNAFLRYPILKVGGGDGEGVA
jgi:hypothetical protein